MNDSKPRPQRSSQHNNKKNKQKGYNKKKSNNNFQKRGNTSKNSFHNPKTTLTEKNVPKEIVIQVKFINQELGNHFSANEVYYTLKDNNFSVEKTLEQLKRKYIY